MEGVLADVICLAGYVGWDAHLLDAVHSCGIEEEKMLVCSL